MHAEFLPLFLLASFSLHFGACHNLIVPAGVSQEVVSSESPILEYCEECGRLCQSLCYGNWPAFKSCCEQIALYMLKDGEFPGQKRSFDPINLYEDEGRFGKRSSVEKRFLGDEDRFGKRSFLGDEDRFGKRSIFGDEDRFGKRSLYGHDDRFGKRFALNDEDRFGKRSAFNDQDRYGKRSAFGYEDRYGKKRSFNGEDVSSSLGGPKRY